MVIEYLALFNGHTLKKKYIIILLSLKLLFQTARYSPLNWMITPSFTHTS